MPRCCGVLRGYLRGICDRPATVEREGKFWCWQHDPVRLEKERQERYRAGRKEHEEREARVAAHFNRARLEEAAGVRDLSDDTLRDIVRLGGLEAIIKKAALKA